jgi:hypothetical protein
MASPPLFFETMVSTHRYRGNDASAQSRWHSQAEPPQHTPAGADDKNLEAAGDPVAVEEMDDRLDEGAHGLL